MRNIVLCGFMGSGKTTLGKILSEKLGMNFVDTDSEIVRTEGKSIAEIFSLHGEEYFRSKETELLNILANKENTVISLGGGIAAKKENHAALKNIGKVILLDCGLEETLTRIKADKTRPLARESKEIEKLYNNRKPIYQEVADIVVDSSKDINETAKTIFQLIGENDEKNNGFGL